MCIGPACPITKVYFILTDLRRGGGREGWGLGGGGGGGGRGAGGEKAKKLWLPRTLVTLEEVQDHTNNMSVVSGGKCEETTFQAN